jgi:hypothetical protein
MRWIKAMSAELIERLRDSLPYLEDEGWSSTAALMSAAANELEELSLKVAKLEKKLDAAERQNIGTSTPRLVARLFR